MRRLLLFYQQHLHTFLGCKTHYKLFLCLPGPYYCHIALQDTYEDTLSIDQTYLNTYLACRKTCMPLIRSFGQLGFHIFQLGKAYTHHFLIKTQVKHEV